MKTKLIIFLALVIFNYAYADKIYTENEVYNEDHLFYDKKTKSLATGTIKFESSDFNSETVLINGKIKKTFKEALFKNKEIEFTRTVVFKEPMNTDEVKNANFITDMESYTELSRYPNGLIKILAQIDNGYGEITRYYKSGKIESITKSSSENIYEKKLYENGTIKSFVFLDKNGQRTGQSKEYFENGNLQSEGQYKNNQRDGIWKYFYEDGNLKQEIPYLNGEFNGISSFYYRDGNLLYTVTFKNGKVIDGSQYDYNGKKTKMTKAHFHNLGYLY